MASLFVCALATAAGASIAGPANNADLDAHRALYARQTLSDMEKWQRRLSLLGQNARLSGRNMSNARRHDLAAAGRGVQQQQRNLRVVNGGNWDASSGALLRERQRLEQQWRAAPLLGGWPKPVFPPRNSSAGVQGSTSPPAH